MQLAVDHEAAVVGEQVGHGSDRKFAGFVGIAEDEFAGGKRYPVALFGQFALTGLAVALDAFEIGIAEAVGKTEVFLVAGLVIDEDGAGILGLEQTGAGGLVHDLFHGGAAIVERGRGKTVDSQPDVDGLLAPHRVPVFAGVAAGIAEDFLARLHALEELDRKTEQSGVGQSEPLEAFVGEGDVDGGLRLAVPALAGGDVGDDLSDEIAAGFGSGKFQQQIAGEGEVVAAQHESLNIGDVQINHLVVLRVRRRGVECGPRLPGRGRAYAGGLRTRRPAVQARGAPFPGTGEMPPGFRRGIFPGWTR